MSASILAADEGRLTERPGDTCPVPSLQWLVFLRDHGTDLKVSKEARVLASVLPTYGKGERIFVSMVSLAKILPMKRETIRNARQELEDKGLLEDITGKPKSEKQERTYRLTVPAEVVPERTTPDTDEVVPERTRGWSSKGPGGGPSKDQGWSSKGPQHQALDLDLDRDLTSEPAKPAVKGH